MNFLRYAHLLKRFGLRSAASLYEHVDQGLLTKPVKVGPKAAGWPEHEIDAITNARGVGATSDEIRALVKRLHAKRDEALAALRTNLAAVEVA
jgi:prophage regulatory protein